MFPFFYFAKVTDNQDPQELGRVRVSRMGEGATDWIPVLAPCAGNGSGVFLLPETGSQVLTLVLDGCQTRQVVIGGLWSEAEKPPETGENSGGDLNRDGRNSLQFFKSRTGSMIVFDDTENAEKILIAAPGGASRLEFLVPEEKISLVTDLDTLISAKGGLRIQARNISVESEKDIGVSGEEISFAAEKQMSLKAEKDLTFEGSSIALN
jgi:phage baseplate assembly protein gpV